MKKCLGSDDKSFEQVLNRHHVTAERFANWLAQPTFRRYLRRIVNALHAQTKVILAIGQKRGAMFLLRTASTTAKSPPDDRARTSRVRACEVLLKFHVMTERHDRLLDQRRPPTPSLAHPDHSEEEVLRLLDVIEGKAPAD